jgi:hypothetical protein
MSHAKHLLVIPAMFLLLVGICACDPGMEAPSINPQQDVQDDVAVTDDAGSQDEGLTDTEEADETTTVANTTRNAPAARELAISTTSLGTWRVGEDNDKTLRATGGSGRYTWEAVGLPNGIALENNHLKGTPVQVERRSVTITVYDKADPEVSVEKALTLTVSEATAAADDASADDDASPQGSTGSGSGAGSGAASSGPLTIKPPNAYNASIDRILTEPDYSISIKVTATGGKPPYTWSRETNCGVDACATGADWPMTLKKSGDCEQGDALSCTFVLSNIEPVLIDPFMAPSTHLPIMVKDTAGATAHAAVSLMSTYPSPGSTSDITARIPTRTADKSSSLFTDGSHIEIHFYEAGGNHVAELMVDYQDKTKDGPLHGQVTVTPGQQNRITNISRITAVVTLPNEACDNNYPRLRSDTTFSDDYWIIKLTKDCQLTCYDDDVASSTENEEEFESAGYKGTDITGCFQVKPGTHSPWQRRADLF